MRLDGYEVYIGIRSICSVYVYVIDKIEDTIINETMNESMRLFWVVFIIPGDCLSEMRFCTRITTVRSNPF